MAKILLDEGFFTRSNKDGYIDALIEFIEKYFDDNIVFFHPFCNPGNLWMLKNEIAVIEKKVMKKGKIFLCDSNATKEYTGEIVPLIDKYSNGFIKKSQLCT